MGGAAGAKKGDEEIVVDAKESKSFSPLVSAWRLVYNHSPMGPAVRAVGPQATIVLNAVGICAEKVRRYVNAPTAAATAMLVLPLGAQRNVIRVIAGCGLSGAALSAVSEARVEKMLPSVEPGLDSATRPWAVVTGCGERSGLGASVARALAARGFGVVVVAANEDDAKVLARRLRMDHNGPCVPVAADFDADALNSVQTLRAALRQANLTANVDVVVHAPEGIFSGAAARTNTIANKKRTSQIYSTEGLSDHQSPPPQNNHHHLLHFGGAGAAQTTESSSDTEDNNNDNDIKKPHQFTYSAEIDDVDPKLAWDMALQARCGAATHLGHVFGSEMAARGRGRCAFVVGGANTELNAALSSAQPPDALTWFSARSSYAASDAYSKALAKSLRRDLARFGVGVTLATKDAPFTLPFLRPHTEELTSPGDLLVDALLRGDKAVTLAPHAGLGAVAPRFVSPLFSGVDLSTTTNTRS